MIAACQNVADALRVVQSDANALTAAVAAERAAATTLNITRRQLELSQVAYLLFINAESSYEQAIISLVQARAPATATPPRYFRRSAVAGGTAQFAKDLREGTHVAPYFDMPYHSTVCSTRFKPLLRQALRRLIGNQRLELFAQSF